MSEILQYLDKLVLELTEKYGYVAVMIGAFFDVIIPIVPSEIILGLAGSSIAKGKMEFVPALIFSLIGNLTAASLLWYLGKKWGTKLIDRFGKFLQFTHEDLAKAETKFKNGGYLFVFFSQFIPLMRSLIPIPSGILDLSYKKFIFTIAAGATIWNCMLLYAGYVLRDNFQEIDGIIKKFGYPLLVLVSFGLIGVVIKFYYDKNKSKVN
ncbi:MAG: DedA family protein [Patescibacteria group bacterium]